MLQCKIFIIKAFTINTSPTSTIVLLEVPALNHKVLDDPVEGAALVAVPFLTSAERTEVVDGLRYDLSEEPDDDAARRLPADLHVEEALARHLGLQLHGSLCRSGADDDSATGVAVAAEPQRGDSAGGTEGERAASHFR